MAVSFIQVHLIYETLSIMVYLLVAKGWSVTRYRITIEDWRLVIILISVFYMSMSIILVLENSVLSRDGFWVAIAVIYGLMYYYIFTNTMRQLRKLGVQVSILEATMPIAITGPLLEKHRMYIVLLLLIFASMCIEIACHCIIGENGSLAAAMFTYELSHLLIFLSIGYIFRPREYSPFFFMLPARMNDARTRAIATVEATEEDGDENEVELAPLILSAASRSSHRSVPASMIIIRTPDKQMHVGVSTALARPATAPGSVPGAPLNGTIEDGRDSDD